MPDIDPTAALRAALEAADRRAANAARERDEARNALQGERGGRLVAEETAVSNAIAAAETEAQTLSQRWAALQQEGNFAEAANVMRQMSEATARVDRFKAQKDWLANQRQVAVAQPQATADPLANFNAQERAWIERNPAYLSDPAFQARVNDAALKAQHRDGHVKDSPEYFQAIERTIYPERFAASSGVTDPQPTTTEAADAGDTGDGDEPFSGADEPVASVALQQQHTRPADPVSVTTDAPAMRIAVNPEAEVEPQQRQQQRAVGKGGEGMRAVAAPPSRRIQQVSNRLAQQRGGVIEPTPEEVQTAITLAESIEPELAQRGNPEEIVRWYYALAHSPSHRLTRRRNWALQAVV